ADAADYYVRESVASRLGDLRVPSLLLNSESDPMVPPRAVRAALRPAPRLEVRWLKGGGHVAFPPDLDAGLGGGVLGADAQVIGWQRGRPAPLIPLYCPLQKLSSVTCTSGPTWTSLPRWAPRAWVR